MIYNLHVRDTQGILRHRPQRQPLNPRRISTPETEYWRGTSHSTAVPITPQELAKGGDEAQLPFVPAAAQVLRGIFCISAKFNT